VMGSIDMLAAYIFTFTKILNYLASRFGNQAIIDRRK